MLRRFGNRLKSYEMNSDEQSYFVHGRENQKSAYRKNQFENGQQQSDKGRCELPRNRPNM